MTEIPISKTLIRARLTYDFEEGMAEEIYYPARPLNLELPIPTLQLKPSEDFISFQLTSNVLAKSVFISMPGIVAQWTDNYFDLLPNEPKTIAIKTQYNSLLSIQNLLFMTLANAFTNSTHTVIII